MIFPKIFLILLVEFIFTARSDSGNNTFVATDKWQTIKEGQSVPAGLHIRINLSTGLKEAKLVNDNGRTSVAKVPDQPSENSSSSEKSPTTPSPQLISQKLEEALKKIPANIFDQSEESTEEVLKKYRSYEEMKEELKEAQMDIRSDFEMITEFIEQFERYSKLSLENPVLFGIFNDINYLVHQIDNALNFIDKGGLEKIVLPTIVNQTNSNLKIKSMNLLGTITHNNPKAQIKAFEQNFGTYLSQIILTSSKEDEVSTAVYALGSLLRKFPHAQKEILSKQGITALMGVLEKNFEIRLKTRVMNLLNDLILEREDAANPNLEDFSPEKQLQYSQFTLEDHLLNAKLCAIINDFFQQSRNDIIRQPDLADDLVQAFFTMRHLCFDVWSESTLFKQTLLTILNKFQESNDDFLLEIATQVDGLYEKLFRSKLKDEL